MNKATHKAHSSGGNESLQRKCLTTSRYSSTKIYPGIRDNHETLVAKNSNKNTKLGRFYPAFCLNKSFVVAKWLIAAAAFTCLCWTIWLIFLTIAPNDTVNRVMNTASFDDGSFWLFIDPPKSLVITSTIALAIVAAGYLGVLGALIICRHKSQHANLVYQIPEKVNLMKKVEQVLDDASNKPTRGKASIIVRKIATAMTRQDSMERKYSKLLMKFGDLALETLLLYQMLESGSPVILIAIFTIVVTSNALICAGMMFFPYERAPMAEIFIDIIFDFLIAIACPMLTIVYCLSRFNFDREKFTINLEVFPVGWFEQSASVVADPVETAIIYKSLKSLRILSTLDFFSRMSVNFTLCYRLQNVVNIIYNPKKQTSSVYPKRNHFGAALLVTFAAFVVIFVEESMRTSSIACAPHPECVVNARRWIIIKTNSLTQCPCLTMIDRDIAPKTFQEWEHPRNVTDKVAQLATTGDLQALSITNRYVAFLPDEMRQCKDFKHLSLEYSHIQEFPPWIHEFTQLEYLHIENEFTSPLLQLPANIFDAMSSLTFLHLATFMAMPQFPTFHGLTNLKSLTLAIFLAIKEFPSFESLQHLERLVIACTPSVESLPDFSPLIALKSFVTSDRGAWCCNGFLGSCNLEDRKCGIVHPVWGTPPVTCLTSNRTTNLATPATLSAVKKFAHTVCGPVLEAGVLEGPPTPDLMAPCNGTLYRQCSRADQIEAMCYNARFMAIACTTNRYPIKMRRLQIARGIGDPCDPILEAWLGCRH